MIFNLTSLNHFKYISCLISFVPDFHNLEICKQTRMKKKNLACHRNKKSLEKKTKGDGQKWIEIMNFIMKFFILI